MSEETAMREPTVSSVMTSPVITAGTETPFKDVVDLLSANGISAVPVIGPHGGLVGVVSEADLLPKQEFHGGTDAAPKGMPRRRVRWYRSLGLSAAEVMTTPVITVRPGDPITLAARRLSEKRVRRVFVVDRDGQLVGVLSRRDVLDVFLRADQDVQADLEELTREAFGDAADQLTIGVADGIAIVDGELELRSETVVAQRLIRSAPGVVGMRSNLCYRTDDVADTEAWSSFLL
jgi:CBS domain-containing protein